MAPKEFIMEFQAPGSPPDHSVIVTVEAPGVISALRFEPGLLSSVRLHSVARRDVRFSETPNEDQTVRITVENFNGLSVAPHGEDSYASIRDEGGNVIEDSRAD